MRSYLIRGFMVAAFALTSLLPVTPASAAPAIDDAGAATLKAVVDEALGFYIELKQKTGEGLTLAGPVEVTPKGSYYEVKIPGAAIANETATMDLGTVMINATPEDDGDYRASIAVPNQMTMKDSDGTTRMVIDLGSQKFSGVYNPALGAFTQADAAYDNVVANITPKADANDKAKPDPVTITMGSVASQIAMTKDGDAWSGPQTTTMRNIMLEFGDNKTSKLSIGEIIAAVSYNKTDLGAAKKLRDQLRQGLQSNGELPAKELQKLVESTMGGMQAIPESGTSNFTMTNLALDVPAAKATPGAQPTSVRLARMGSSSTLDGMKTDAGTLTSKTTLTGLALTGHEGPLLGLIPSEAAFNITAAQVPFKSAMENFSTAINSAIEAQSGPEGDSAPAQAQAKLHMEQAVASLPALLAKAGTTITINDTYTTASDLASTLDGALTAASGAPYIFAGKMTLKLKGIDELITKLQEMSRTSNNPRAAGYAQALIFMQLSGQLAKAADGKSERTYAFELTQDGKVLLNGADMKGMIPQGGVPAAPAPATP